MLRRFHLALDVTVNVVRLPIAPGFQVVVFSLSDGAAAWVTDTLRVITLPVPVTVAVAVLCPPVLAAARSVKLPFVCAGADRALMVSQVALLCTSHVLLDVTPITCVLNAAGAGHDVGDNVILAAGACCVTVMVRLATPVAEKVSVPIRTTVPVLACAITEIVLFPLLDHSDELSQPALLVTDQFVLDVTVADIWF